MSELVREQAVPVFHLGVASTWDAVIDDLMARRDRFETPTPILDAVIHDANARDGEGRRRYGVPLQPGNGRDSLVDAYQELLDAAVYLKNAMIESPPPPNDLRLRQAYDRAIGLAIEVRGLIAERATTDELTPTPRGAGGFGSTGA